jgi:hypothetical protein
LLFQNNEKRDLQRIPYARAGCYFYINEDYFRRQLKLIFIYAEEMMQHGDVAFWLDYPQGGQKYSVQLLRDEGSLRLVMRSGCGTSADRSKPDSISGKQRSDSPYSSFVNE